MAIPPCPFVCDNVTPMMRMWASSLAIILAVVGAALPSVAAAADHPGVACPVRPPAPVQSDMTPSHPHATQPFAPSEPERPRRTAVATFALG
jgi:hypothetical protein